MTRLALDPGPTVTGWCALDSKGVPTASGVTPNTEVLAMLAGHNANRLVIEMIASYGMPVGAEVFETCVWIGRFQQTWKTPNAVVLTPRRVVKLHLCNDMRAKDSNIWQALLDRFGGKSAAVGLKKTPGPLYGITSHARAALALAITDYDRFRL